MAAAHSQQYATFKQISCKHCVACSHKKVSLVEVIALAISNLIAYEEVHAASRMNKLVIGFVAYETRRPDERAKFISILGLVMYPLDSSAQKVVIGNVPTFLKKNYLQCCGNFLRLKMLPVSFDDERVGHIIIFAVKYLMLRKECTSLNFVWP